ncbi:biotin/lipoyl-containing protein [Planctomycetes bacterium K23_9]|uniref:Biotin carboxyl carrier protein of acetyl-CoA carboxylase n=1 Tax=Stieleria marina TaxID=1930275 RepID=A0A517NTS2_9BACT|nr:Biotin carboxyl carrier protein of acetyl-CoA carboxylase [Planctomycetes bacterium K23_9]
MDDEHSFLRAIHDSPGDEALLQSYADWLSSQSDSRGEYLRLELERVAGEKRLLELEGRLQSFGVFEGVDPRWLDSVIPLQIRSPLVGKFYVAPDPDAPPFVQPGDLCRPDTIIGIVESMKIFNEIPAGMSCVITDVLVRNEQTVDYGHQLFDVGRPPRVFAGG